MAEVLVSWIGHSDIQAAEAKMEDGVGPVAKALQTGWFKRAWLLSDYPKERVGPYLEWLRARVEVPFEVLESKLRGPTHFGDIHREAVAGVEAAIGVMGRGAELTFHISPGTPAMAAVWILLSKTRFPAGLIESSRRHGVQWVSVPFQISAEFLPDLLRGPDERLRLTSFARPGEVAEFSDIIFRSEVMGRVIERARRVAIRSVPVLIEGETGTGKELLARAIHKASLRSGGPFVAVNCGAIPSELVESELFGHEKGAFTGASQQRDGYFQAAENGTLFLDEVGELPASTQVKLLRVLQEGTVTRLGATEAKKVNARIVAATNRTIIDEVAAGRFREDLFYRLAVAVLHLPALRERPGDLGLLIDHLLGQINQQVKDEPGNVQKNLSVGARNILLQHSWPGNVRELFNTIKRATVWSDGAVINTEDAVDALLPSVMSTTTILGRPLGGGFELQSVLDEVTRHYLSRAMVQAASNKTQAAKLVGLSSHQTLSNWLERCGL